MKTLMIIFACLFLTACQTTIVKKWSVAPERRDQFEADKQKCASWAVGQYRAADRFDYCLMSSGYRLVEVTEE